ASLEDRVQAETAEVVHQAKSAQAKASKAAEVALQLEKEVQELRQQLISEQSAK
ncbi:unnamed protein product, partial [Symbiodinium microadriaticum]